MSTTANITFKAPLQQIEHTLIIRVPADASQQLPSRSQVMVAGTCNGVDFCAPLEPDGMFSHWLEVDAQLLTATKLSVGDTANVTMHTMKDWPDPVVPADLQTALATDTAAMQLWQNITPMARWEWIRWIRSTSNTETRQRRIEVALSKLNAGKRRPCCWNRNLCSVMEVSKGGVLLEPTA